MPGQKRKERLSVYSIGHNGPTVLLLSALFICGLLVSLFRGAEAALVYLLLWIASYGVIFAGTCRYCAYYGKRCPIPLEGACVGRFFGKKGGRFGWVRLFWATVAYLLRTIVPFWIIVQDRLSGWGTLYGGILLLFWVVHLRITGCPNCINTECPLNDGSRAENA